MACDRFFARLAQTVDTARHRGLVPIVMTPFPRNHAAMGPVQLVSWIALYHRIMAMRKTGTIVVDATAALGARPTQGSAQGSPPGSFDGTYQAGLSDDEVHPNDSGHARLVPPLAAALAGIGALDACNETDIQANTSPGEL
jgi:hypothetical protein